MLPCSLQALNACGHSAWCWLPARACCCLRACDQPAPRCPLQKTVCFPAGAKRDGVCRLGRAHQAEADLRDRSARCSCLLFQQQLPCKGRAASCRRAASQANAVSQAPGKCSHLSAKCMRLQVALSPHSLPATPNPPPPPPHPTPTPTPPTPPTPTPIFSAGTTKRPVPLQHNLYYAGQLFTICQGDAYNMQASVYRRAVGACRGRRQVVASWQRVSVICAAAAVVRRGFRARVCCGCCHPVGQAAACPPLQALP